MAKKKLIRFSIIIRIYNAEKYLKQCIESIIGQTYKNWELVLVNDGSSDSSLEICKEYAQKDKRITVINQKNQGGVIAQLIGFNNVRGEYICNLDSDDWYDNNLLGICNSYLLENKEIDLLLFGYRILYENGQISVFSLTNENQILDTKQLVEYIMKKTPHALWLKVYKKEIVHYTDFEQKLIKKDNQKFRSNNDLFVGTPLLFNAKKTLVVKDILYNYRMLSDSVSHKRNPYTRIEISLNTMEYFYVIFKEHNFISDETLYLIHTEILREILPEIYIIFRHFEINIKKINLIKANPMYKLLLKEKDLKKIVKRHNLRQRLAFSLFSKLP